MTTKLTIFFIAMSMYIFNGYAQAYNPQQLKEGDLLFQQLNCGSLCKAIDAVTYGIHGRDFSHCAIVVKASDSLQVVEAIGGVVQYKSIFEFYKRTNDNSIVKHITQMRLKPEYTHLIHKATYFAKDLVGTPYDNEFRMNNGSMYCSELLYEVFKYAHNGIAFFPLQPMTFKSPNTKKYFPAWVKYYKALGKPIPQGKLGTNPGAISRSNKLTLIQ